MEDMWVEVEIQKPLGFARVSLPYYVDDVVVEFVA